MNNGVCVGLLRIVLLGILNFKGLTKRRLYKSFGDKSLITTETGTPFVFVLPRVALLWDCSSSS
jgi:hypothetical protein